MDTMYSEEWQFLKSTVLKKHQKSGNPVSRGGILWTGIPTPVGYYIRCLSFGVFKELHFSILSSLKEIVDPRALEGRNVIFDFALQDDDVMCLQRSGETHFERSSASKAFNWKFDEYFISTTKDFGSQIFHDNSTAITFYATELHGSGLTYFACVNGSSERLKSLISSAQSSAQKCLKSSSVVALFMGETSGTQGSNSTATVHPLSDPTGCNSISYVDMIPNFSIKSKYLSKGKRCYPQWIRFSPKAALINAIDFRMFYDSLFEWYNSVASILIGNKHQSSSTPNPASCTPDGNHSGALLNDRVKSTLDFEVIDMTNIDICGDGEQGRGEN